MIPMSFALMDRQQLVVLAEKAASEQHLPVGVFPGLIQVESDWNPNAVNVNRNADGSFLSFDRGLVQINSAAHPDVTDAEAFDPAFALTWGARYLAGLYQEQHGDITAALEAYNSGRPTGDAAYADMVLAAAKEYGYTPAPAPTPEPSQPAEPSSPIVSPPAADVPEPKAVPFDFATPGQVIGVYALSPSAIADSLSFLLPTGFKVSPDAKATTLATFHDVECELDTGTTNGLGFIASQADATAIGLKASGEQAILGATGGALMGDGTCAVAFVDEKGRAVIFQDVPFLIDPELHPSLIGTQPFLSRGLGLQLRPLKRSLTLFTDSKE